MAAFNILQHLDKLEPDGGNNDPKGDHSYLCPVCGSNNFKVHIKTGKWGTYGCDCGNTEAGKRKIREALSPAVSPAGAVASLKSKRPKQERHWDYFTAVTLETNQPAITVNRWAHGYAHMDNPLFDSPRGNEPTHITARARFGRIAIANSDAGAMPTLDSAIDEAHRAVNELSNA